MGDRGHGPLGRGGQRGGGGGQRELPHKVHGEAGAREGRLDHGGARLARHHPRGLHGGLAQLGQHLGEVPLLQPAGLVPRVQCLPLLVVAERQHRARPGRGRPAGTPLQGLQGGPGAQAQGVGPAGRGLLRGLREQPLVQVVLPQPGVGEHEQADAAGAGALHAPEPQQPVRARRRQQRPRTQELQRLKCEICPRHPQSQLTLAQIKIPDNDAV
mmetsp:Transcript_17761/g.28758  ORF Transcript_17761/g.28758 Transcript_17761/m.28758 type:complete len:214 (-) Transcript_17761:588-1229(-)